MKKILLLLTIFFWPINIYAYSKFIIPGGQTIGVDVDTKGVMIIGFYKIDGKYNKSSLEIGDYIIEIDNKKVESIKDITDIIESKSNKDIIKLKYIRNNEINEIDFPIIKSEGKYKTGIYIKEGIKGIGTLSYIDPETNIYGALGHEIIEGTTSRKIEIDSGYIFKNEIIGIEKSSPGIAGSKIASFDYSIKYGNIIKNTDYGIFGIYNNPKGETMEIDSPKLGAAKIRTVLNSDIIKEYDIEIVKLNETSKIKNITFKIKDEELLSKTGGIVQGMSGSPIIQNNKIVGVLTHVIVDNPTTGYGIFITTMLEEGEKNN